MCSLCTSSSITKPAGDVCVAGITSAVFYQISSAFDISKCLGFDYYRQVGIV